MTKNVTAVVVTYNRKALLMECLQAILAQTHPVTSIVLIDNASTDGTKETLAQEGFLQNPVITYHAMPTNTGGAGGFYEGFRLAREIDCDWVWVMDDDTIPNPDCLARLLAADDFIAAQPKNEALPAAYRPSFYASAIYGPEGEFMNLPQVSYVPSPNGYAYWYQFLHRGLVGIFAATFVSILIKKEAMVRCGLPVKDYFIWGDDAEYTRRLTKYYGDAYMVGDSVAVHKRFNAKALNLLTEPDATRKTFYRYLYRNNKINELYYSNYSMPKEYLRYLALVVLGLLRCKNKGALQAHAIQCKGVWQALRQFKTIKAYIDGQLNNG